MRKMVILLGAGAATPWGGKLTNPMTKDLIKNCSFKTNNNVNYLCFLQKHLHNFFTFPSVITNRYIHFELILSAIEYLHEYYSSKENKNQFGRTPDRLALYKLDEVLESAFPTEIIKLPGDPIVTYSFKNNEHFKQAISKGYYRSLFYRELHRETLNNIRKLIYKYSSDETPYNDKLKSFFKYLKNKGYTLRIYSTNYDNIPKACFPKKWNLFNGFNMMKRPGDTRQFPIGASEIGVYNLRSIVNQKKDCFYNLHGSIHFDQDFNAFKDWKQNNRIIYHEDLSQHYGLNLSNDSDLLYNTIISGQQKVQRTAEQPYFSFLQSFYKDCLTADRVFSVGFSFSDTHINRAISDAWRCKVDFPNNKTAFRISIISYFKRTESNLNIVGLLGESIRNCFPQEIGWYPTLFLNKKKNGWWRSEDNNIKVFDNGFDSFLDCNKNWKKML